MTRPDPLRRQGTVAAWGPSGGSVVLDDGSRLALAAELLGPSVFRFLRSGQRLELLVEGGSVTWIGLAGMTPPGTPSPQADHTT